MHRTLSGIKRTAGGEGRNMHRIKQVSLIALGLLIVLPVGIVYGAGHGALETTAGNLEAQLNMAVTHAHLAKNETTLEGIHSHLEHVINAIEGAGGANYGDLNGDGTTEDFGDGIGVVGHATTLAAQADAVASALPDDAELVAITTAISTGAGNAITKSGSARDIALGILNETSLSLAKILLGPGGNTVISDLEAALNGSVALGDGAVQASASIQDLDTYLTSLEEVPDIPNVPGQPPVVGEPAIPMLAQAVLIASVLLLVAGGLLVIRGRRAQVRI